MNFESLSYWSVAELLFFTLINRTTYMGIRSALDLGVGYEYYLDVYCINLTVQALCEVSSYFWIIYSIIPGYIFFYAFKYLLAWANSTGTQEEPEEDLKKGKKDRAKVKYLKSRK